MAGTDGPGGAARSRKLSQQGVLHCGMAPAFFLIAHHPHSSPPGPLVINLQEFRVRTSVASLGVPELIEDQDHRMVNKIKNSDHVPYSMIACVVTHADANVIKVGHYGIITHLPPQFIVLRLRTLVTLHDTAECREAKQVIGAEVVRKGEHHV
ncbi:hypothetical protein NDU88_004671 [Pleurodeles waltl]|uniref:Uncharacterized protein n=1 Tax=Pleurodeles waltl TaxID=8319 RepID=A0AAV7W7C6_PLEWA|nr:hypothetical protein NDU88_004671 [Pleurodeles waltl]